MTVAAPALTLITADDCHFCGRAKALLAHLGVKAREVEVDSAEAFELPEQISLTFLPVLTDGDRVIAYGRFSEKRLRKELEL